MVIKSKFTKQVNSKRTKRQDQIPTQEDAERRQREAVMHINLNIQNIASNAEIKKDLTAIDVRFTRIPNNIRQSIYAKTTVNKTLTPDKIWERQKAKLKATFPELDSDDLRY